MQIEQWQFDGWEGPLDYYFREGLTDGLPVVPPTPERVQALFNYCGLAPEEILGTEGIRHKRFPAGKAAVSAVMAGCLPEHFPVVAAAVSAVCDRAYNFHASSTSTKTTRSSPWHPVELAERAAVAAPQAMRNLLDS